MDEANKSPRVKGLQEEKKLVWKRRQQAGIDGYEPSMGLALSGGGVRSATFCFGLLRALAANGVLKKFDYLSTVSGGGYIGSALGRLYQPDQGAQAVEDGLKAEDTLLLWWLRSNGRYLIPAGIKDMGVAFASILRGFIATQLEIANLLLLIASVLVAPYLWNHYFPMQQGSLIVDFWKQLPNYWCWAFFVFLLFGLTQIFAYWFCRERPRSLGLVALGTVIFFAASAYQAERLLVQAISQHNSADGLLTIDLLLMLTAISIAALSGVLFHIFVDHKQPAETVRLRRTLSLSNLLWCCLAIFSMAVVDMLAFALAASFNGTHWHWAASATGILTISVTAVRAFLPDLQQAMHNKNMDVKTLTRLANYLGLALVLLLLIVWTTVLYAAIFKFEKIDGVAAQVWAGVLVLALSFLWLTRNNFDQLNLASMHHFYRSRLERVYLGLGNYFPRQQRDSRFPESPLRTASRGGIAGVKSLLQTMPSDDIALNAYKPHESGGPVHLINCCINQSVDDRTGNYNADRKGIALTVSALGVETGTNLPIAISETEENGLGKLSRWLAVSGAAVGSGMGSRTEPGLASLVFISGMRLGYWCLALLQPHPSPVRWGDYFARLFPKASATVAELFGRFPGLRNHKWYVSDGGHFDNTGVYALLKRRLDVIVLADCGADPEYRFDDIENLVRKAEIDYSTKIEFINPSLLDSDVHAEFKQLLGTPESISPALEAACLMVGRITYPAQGEGVNFEAEKTATLLVVKPRRLDQLPFDIVGYADRNLEFPQQSTANQFFSEEQWESYHQLGLHIGRFVSHEHLHQARALVTAHENTTLQRIKVDKTVPEASETEAGKRRQRLASAVGATVGAGLSLSLVLGVWQGLQQYMTESRDTQNRILQQISETETAMESGSLDKLPLAALQQIHDVAKVTDNSGEIHDRIALIWGVVNQLCGSASDGQTVSSADDQTAGIQAKMRKQKCDLITDLGTLGYSQTRLDQSKLQYWQTSTKPAISFAALIDTSTMGSQTTPAPAATDIAKAPSRAPAAAESSQSLACKTTDGSIQIDMQIYDENSRVKAESLAREFAKIEGVDVVPVENVVTTARKNGEQAPLVWYKPALLFHAGVPDACRTLLLEKAQELLDDPVQRDLPNNDTKLEVWLPVVKRARS